jgi:hypothetical protein
VYALGCVLYELLTGRPPFTGQGGEERSGEIIQAHLHQSPLPPSRAAPGARLPAWVDELILWALAKRPAERFDDVHLFTDLFAQGLEGDLATGDALSIRTAMTRPIDTRLEEPAGASPQPPTATATPAAVPMRRRAARAVSRSRLPRRMWRLVLALLVANALLAGVHYFQDGTIPGLYDGSRDFRQGASATVIADTLNVRAEPGLLGAAILTLPAGSRVTLEGAPVVADGETWWPVVIPDRRDLGAGHVWQGGIEPDVTTGRMLVEDELEQLWDRLRDRVTAR